MSIRLPQVAFQLGFCSVTSPELAQVDRAMGRCEEAQWDIARYRDLAAQKAHLVRLRAQAMARFSDVLAKPCPADRLLQAIHQARRG